MSHSVFFTLLLPAAHFRHSRWNSRCWIQARILQFVEVLKFCYRLETYSLHWSIYESIQIGNENLKVLVGIPNPLSTQGVIISIPAASVYYENVDKYI